MFRLKTEKQELQGRCDKSLKEICHDVTSRDLQVRSMEKEISLLKADMACRRDDVDRYIVFCIVLGYFFLCIEHLHFLLLAICLFRKTCIHLSLSSGVHLLWMTMSSSSSQVE